MIFSELYGVYYNTVAAILSEAIGGTLTNERLVGLIDRHAFSESVLSILPALKTGRWQLLRPDLTTPLKHTPTMPLTTLQKRWLKAILDDPRVRLFGCSIDGLDEVTPLFRQEDYEVYDRYLDGDNYEDEGYIARFRTILAAINSGTCLTLTAVDRHGNSYTTRILPKRLEYSLKDDKFRLYGVGSRRGGMINLARIRACDIDTGKPPQITARRTRPPQSLTLVVTDTRRALERVLLHFAHFEKEAETLPDGRYRLTLQYQASDETELVIRVLSFGPHVEVVSPSAFRELIRQRLRRQIACELS